MPTQSRRAVLRHTGGHEVLEWEDVTLPDPGPGEALVRHEAVGLNFIDVYFRTGLYPTALPAQVGGEAAGVVEAVGEGVTGVAVGDRVAYATGGFGAYATGRNIGAQHLLPLPDGVSFETAAAVTLKGLTVAYLFDRTVEIGPDETVLMLPAAGGVGLIACQWARSEGVRLIGAAGGPEKCALARDNGASETIDYRSADLAEEARRLTDGRGVDVVMDAVGRDTFVASLDALRPLGMMISFGNASGKVEPFDLQLLSQKGSLKLTRPTLFSHAAHLREMAAKLYGKVASGEVVPRIDSRVPLAKAAEAQRALEARRTTGSTVLVP